MKTKPSGLALVLAALLQFMGMGSAKASLITFEVHWAKSQFGEIPDANSPVLAVGLVTIESTLLPNPGTYRGDVTPIIHDLTITVAGAAQGNGTFNLSYYRQFYWTTGYQGGTLDLTKELVGQPLPDGTGFLTNHGPDRPTDGVPARDSGPYGEFNLISICYSPSCPAPIAPTGIDSFTMRTMGLDGDLMIVNSIRPVTTIPEPTMLPIIGVALIVLVQFDRLKHSLLH